MFSSFNHKTTTFPRRRTAVLADIAGLLPPPGPEPLEVLEIGPGLALKGIGRHNDWGGLKLIKRLETALRRIPFPDSFYENFETTEILASFGERPVNLTLLDVNAKLLRVIKANMAPAAVNTVAGDLGIAGNPAFARLQGRFDVVFCFATIGRVPGETGRANARRNVASFLKPGGLLASDAGLAYEGTNLLAPNGAISRKA